MTEARETFYAITDDGVEHACLTPALAWIKLLDLQKPGKIICRNQIDPGLPDEWVVAIRHADGRWESMGSPVETLDEDEEY